MILLRYEFHLLHVYIKMFSFEEHFQSIHNWYIEIMKNHFRINFTDFIDDIDEAYQIVSISSRKYDQDRHDSEWSIVVITDNSSSSNTDYQFAKIKNINFFLIRDDILSLSYVKCLYKDYPSDHSLTMHWIIIPTCCHLKVDQEKTQSDISCNHTSGPLCCWWKIVETIGQLAS